MTTLASKGDCPKQSLMKYCASELIQNACTIAIFHLGGAAIVFKSGRLNHVASPVALLQEEQLFASSINLWATSEFSQASSEPLSAKRLITYGADDLLPTGASIGVPRKPGTSISDYITLKPVIVILLITWLYVPTDDLSNLFRGSIAMLTYVIQCINSNKEPKK